MATLTPPTKSKSPPTVTATLAMATPTNADPPDDTPITFIADEAHSPHSQSPEQNRNESVRKESSSTTEDVLDEGVATKATEDVSPGDVPDEGVATEDIHDEGVALGDVPVVGMSDRDEAALFSKILSTITE